MLYLELVCWLVGISSYSESVSSMYYDFSNIEKSARNCAAVVDLIGAKHTNQPTDSLSPHDTQLHVRAFALQNR